jgi:hypothetical protein
MAGHGGPFGQRRLSGCVRLLADAGVACPCLGRRRRVFRCRADPESTGIDGAAAGACSLEEGGKRAGGGGGNHGDVAVAGARPGTATPDRMRSAAGDCRSWRLRGPTGPGPGSPGHLGDFVLIVRGADARDRHAGGTG